MESVRVIQARLAPLARRVRWSRAVTWGTRGLLGSLLVAFSLLLARPVVPEPTGVWLLALLILGIASGLWYGWVRPVPLGDLARLAEEALNLKARLSTALECAERQDRSPFACALYADALRALPPFVGRDFLPLRLPREGWALMPAMIVVLLLWVAPPLPWHVLGGPEELAKAERPDEERGATLSDEDTRRFAAAETREIRDRRWQRGGTPSSRLAQEVDALFKDSPLAKDRPDFSSFLMGGDDRMRFLGRSQAIPDLKAEGLRSPYQIVVQKMDELSDGGTRRLTPEEARRLLNEIQRLGKKGGLSGDPGAPGSEELTDATGGGIREALERALEELRKQEEGRLQRSEVPSSESGRGRRGGQSAAGDDEALEDEHGRDDVVGTFAGRGKSEGARGEPTPRPDAKGRSTGVQGERGTGSSQTYNTNLLGVAEGGEAKLPRADILTRYRQMMEEALSRDPIPPNYREQVKAYFDSLSKAKGDGGR